MARLPILFHGLSIQNKGNAASFALLDFTIVATADSLFDAIYHPYVNPDWLGSHND